MIKTKCAICGKEIFRWPYRLRLLNFCSRSCTSKYYGNHQYKHGLSNSRFRRKWLSMRRRCYCKTWHAYNRYGGRGIKICKRWHNFLNFRDDMYVSYLKHVKHYGEKQTTLDRINNDGNYTLRNCRWATWKEQFANRRYNLELYADN